MMQDIILPSGLSLFTMIRDFGLVTILSFMIAFVLHNIRNKQKQEDN